MALQNRTIAVVDPGQNGAVALFNTVGVVNHLGDLPTYIEQRKGGKKKKHLDANKLAEFLKAQSVSALLVESVHAMPGQGVVSMFNFGVTTGIIRGVAAGVGIEYMTITPQSWKKHVGLLGTDKHAALDLARKLYPELAPLLKRKKDVDRADALLMGRTYLDRLRGLRGLVLPAGDVDVLRVERDSIPF